MALISSLSNGIIRQSLAIAIWYDTRRYFNARSRAELSQLNLPHGIKNEKVEKKEKVKSKTRICSETSVNSPGIRGVSPKEEKKSYDRKDLQKMKVLSLDEESGESMEPMEEVPLMD